MDLEPIGQQTPETPLAPLPKKWQVSLFGDRKLKMFSPDEQTVAVTLFGDQTMDLEHLSSGTIHIVSVGVFGDLEVKVPKGTRIMLDGFTLFGDIEDEPDPGTQDNQLTVRVTRFGMFGDVEIDIADDDDDD